MDILKNTDDNYILIVNKDDLLSLHNGICCANQESMMDEKVFKKLDVVFCKYTEDE